MNIYIRNLCEDFAENELLDLFVCFGTVSSTKILKNKSNGKGLGTGLVIMRNIADAKNAIKELNNIHIRGRMISVSGSD